MEHILKNELLYADENQVEIYQTYNKDKNSFGLYRQSPEGNRKLDAYYILVHPFENEKAAALKDDGENTWVWIDTDLEETPMDMLDKVLWEVLKVKNSTCNCASDGNFMECDLCTMGEIFNRYNWKIVKEDTGLIVFEYDTETNTYTIRLSEWDTFINLTVDYMWEQEEVETRLKGIIDTFEEQNDALEEFITLCLLKRDEGSPAVQLIPYTVTINMSNADSITTSETSNTNNRTVLGFDDFPY